MSEELKPIFKKLYDANIFHLSGGIMMICSDYFRVMTWYTISILVWIINGIQGVVSKLYTINTFFSSSEMEDFINDYKPLIWTILAISIAILGMKIILNRQSNRKQLPTNILLSLLVVTFLTTFMVKLNDVTKLAVDGTNIDMLATQMVKEHVTDLYYVDKNNYADEYIKYGSNSIGEDTESKLKLEDLAKGSAQMTGEMLDIGGLTHIDITEQIDVDEIDKDHRDLYLYKYKNDKLVKTGSNFFTGPETYNRYAVDWIPLLASLVITAIALICVSIKLTRIIIELAFNNLFATLLAFGDIEDGKKLKEVIKHILGMFAAMWATAVMLKIYFLYSSWITNNFNDSGSTVLKLVLLLGGSLAVIDGPNIVEKVLGVDAGLKSGWGVVMGAVGGAKVAGKVGMFVGKTALTGGASTAADAGAAGAKVAAGAGAGAKAGAKTGEKASSSISSNTANDSKNGLMGNGSKDDNIGSSKGDSSKENNIGGNKGNSSKEGNIGIGGSKGNNSRDDNIGGNKGDSSREDNISDINGIASDLGGSGSSKIPTLEQEQQQERERENNTSDHRTNDYKSNASSPNGSVPNMTIGNTTKNETIKSVPVQQVRKYDTKKAWKFKQK